MLKSVQKLLSTFLLLMLLLFLAYQGLMYFLARDQLPAGMAVAGLDVGRLTRDEAGERLKQHYNTPITIEHEVEQVPIDPANVGFTLDLEAMLAEAEAYKAQQTVWQGYVRFLIGRTLPPVEIGLQAAHDREALRQQLASIASLLDKPASAPQLVGVGNYAPGQPGYVTDIETTLPLAELALYQSKPENRHVKLALTYQEPIELNLDVLEDQLRRELAKTDSIIGSIFIMDLQTGEEIGIDADVAISGLSILKIAIFVEAYRALDRAPNAYEQELFMDTATRSSNYGANQLLHVVAGENNTYQGAALLTQSLHRLGLVNTFMAIPYDAAEVATRPNTYVTPANSVPNLMTRPDPARQTTAEDIGTLLAMIYHCANGSGALLAVYAGQVTPEECQAIIDIMVLNEEGNLIRLGVPEGVPVSHKHGWDGTTYGDAAIVLSPGGDYVIVTYVTQPGSWLEADTSFPLLWELSRLTYNYFNFEAPYLDDPMPRAEQAAMEREAELATATAVALEAEVAVTPSP